MEGRCACRGKGCALDASNTIKYFDTADLVSIAEIASTIRIDDRKRSLNLINEDNNKRHHNPSDTTTTTAAALVSPPSVLPATATRGDESQQYQTGIDNDSMPTPAGVLAIQMNYWNSQDSSKLFGVK